MMQKFLLSILLLVLISIGFTQTYTDYKDIVILKDGSKIHGIIIEEKPYEYIKIQSGKNIFVFEFDEIELLKKELVNKIELEQKKLEQKTWSFTFGLGTNRNFSLLGISKDFKIGDQYSFFVTADIPVIIILSEYHGDGQALAGIGFAFQNNYNETGFNISFNTGQQYKNELEGYFWHSTIHLRINHQWEIDNDRFLSLGIICGNCYTKTSAIRGSDSVVYLLPTISYDIRF